MDRYASAASHPLQPPVSALQYLQRPPDPLKDGSIFQVGPRYIQNSADVPFAATRFGLRSLSHLCICRDMGQWVQGSTCIKWCALLLHLRCLFPVLLHISRYMQAGGLPGHVSTQGTTNLHPVSRHQSPSCGSNGDPRRWAAEQERDCAPDTSKF